MRNNSSRRFTLVVAVIAIAATVLVNLIHSTQWSHRSITPTQTNQQDSGNYPGATAPELATAHCQMRGVLPDPNCTPGATNSNVTQANIGQTICASGFTKTIRPPAEYTDQLKKQQMAEYGFTDSIHSHEEDHLISLELGGAPSDPKNLWPEPHASPNAKDQVENFLHTAVCENKISLQEAQRRIATNWTTAEQGL